ncbi:unnamed protein product, partial [Pylaiella littoralis]
ARYVRGEELSGLPSCVFLCVLKCFLYGFLVLQESARACREGGLERRVAIDRASSRLPPLQYSSSCDDEQRWRRTNDGKTQEWSRPGDHTFASSHSSPPALRPAL